MSRRASRRGREPEGADVIELAIVVPCFNEEEALPETARRLLACLDELLEAGGSAVVVEHNLDLIAESDYLIDLGPEGGPGGGCVVATGTPRQIARSRRSHTGAALRERARLE